MNCHNILVVEDDPNDENLTLRALRGVQQPCSVVVARSANDALDFLLRKGAFAERSTPTPDVVFLDNTLPGIPGNELVKRIRSIPELETVPLVVFSGSSDESLIERCLASGANNFVEKPLDMADYLSTLRGEAERWLTRSA